MRLGKRIGDEKTPLLAAIASPTRRRLLFEETTLTKFGDGASVALLTRESAGDVVFATPVYKSPYTAVVASDSFGGAAVPIVWGLRNRSTFRLVGMLTSTPAPAHRRLTGILYFPRAFIANISAIRCFPIAMSARGFSLDGNTLLGARSQRGWVRRGFWGASFDVNCRHSRVF